MTAVSYNVAGGNGCISVTANVMPLHMALFTEPSPAGVKYAMTNLELI